MRAEAEALKKTWELLDYLPRPEPSTSFTHRTLERLAVAQTGSSGGPWRDWSWLAPLAWAAAMLIAMVGGLFAAHHLFQPSQSGNPPPPGGTAAAPKGQDIESTMSSDWDMLKSLQWYIHVDDVDLLRQLNQKDFFGDDEPGS
jgi:hypothetical protein